MRPLNKKGEATILIWVALALIALFVANEVGLFSVFPKLTPQVGQPSGTDSLVNPVYYEAITESYPCVLDGFSYVQDEGSFICIGGDVYKTYCQSPQVIVPTGNRICGYTTDCRRSTRIMESCRTPYGKDCGPEMRTVSASNFQPELVQECSENQQCTYFEQWNTPDGFYPAIKCGDLSDKYLPDKKMCVGNILYETNSEGSGITPTQCGFTCSNNACIECQDGSRRCAQNPGATTDVEICLGGQWIALDPPEGECIGDEQCVLGQCTSEFVGGEMRCNGLQPQLYTSDKNWINDGESCDLECIENSPTDVSCRNECDSAGFICAGGFLQECTTVDRDNELNNIGTCISGACSTDSQCAAAHEIGDKYCVGDDIFIAISSGDEFDLFGGVSGRLFEACANSCQPSGTNDAICTKAPSCEGNEGLSICTDQFTRKECSLDGQSYTEEEFCPDTFEDGFCSVNNGIGVCEAPNPECAGTEICTEAGVIRECNNGQTGSLVTNCNGLGCSVDSNGNPQCIDECAVEDIFECREGDSYKCVEDTLAKGQLVLEFDTECGNRGCNPNNGLCASECTGLQECVSGAIYQCNNGEIGDIIDQCNSAGCDTNQDICLNECSAINTYQCVAGDSVLCFKNETNGQNLERTIECGSEGCSTQTGQCVGREPNSFACVGEALHSTDENGFLSDNPLKICSSEPDRMGLTPYCSNGFSDCKVCEENDYICGEKELYQCADPFTGDKKNVQSCEAGCVKNGDSYLCDQLVEVVKGTQNFFADEDVLITLSLEGSKSERGIKTPYKATITGPGVSKSDSGISDNSGAININFGTNPVGEYSVVVTLDDFQREILITSKVTNDYRVKLIGDQVIQDIPGAETVVNVEALDKDGGAPDNVIVTNSPGELTVVSIPSGKFGEWVLELEGEPGVYDIALKPIKNQVELEEQFISVEVRRPKLEISTNIDDTLKPGESVFDINVVGPQLSDGTIKTKGITPDNIKATISRSPAQDLPLLDAGSGSYTVEYDFLEEGTYTINVEVSKDGYESDIFSKQVQVSVSGQVTPPSSSTPASSTPTSTTTSPDTGTGATSQLKDNPALIIIILVILYFLIAGRKK